MWVILSAGAKVQEMEVTGLLLPSSIQWESTAPMTYGEASQASSNGSCHHSELKEKRIVINFLPL